MRITDQNGEPWLAATDTCSAIGIKNPSDAIKRLDDDEKGVVSIYTLGGNQDLLVINESGFYNLVLSSRKQTPQAKAFKKWVTSEVLPSIRKTGGYKADAAPDTAALITAITELTREVAALRSQLATKGTQSRKTTQKSAQIETHRISLPLSNGQLQVEKFYETALMACPGAYLTVTELLEAYQSHCHVSAEQPYYHTVNTLCKALNLVDRTFHRRKRRKLFPDGQREIVYDNLTLMPRV
jgi:prophage antirepressor-like protein